jgi:cytochrome P450/NADPH-cytochrome P450 reductase
MIPKHRLSWSAPEQVILPKRNLKTNRLGIAPFMGFIQERASQAKENANLGPAYLFFGCRHPDHDYLYRKQLEQWDKEGVIHLRPVFSRYESKDCKYVQHKLWECRDEVYDQLKDNAKVYLCGEGGGMAGEVKETIGKVWKEGKGCREDEMKSWMKDELTERFSIDVFL